MPNVSMWRHLGMASAVVLWTLALVSSVAAQVPRQEPSTQGTSYAYRVDAVFEDARGVGKRTDDVRPCSLTFVK